jgi:hypothetical protein
MKARRGKNLLIAGGVAVLVGKRFDYVVVALLVDKE